MNTINFDVDIDFADRDLALKGLRYTSASIARKDGLEKHNTGVYFQEIPKDPRTNLANIDHKTAQGLGYLKVDFLNVSIYEGVRNEAHLEELMREPNWDLLKVKEIVQELFHIGDYFDLVNLMKPNTVEQLAIVLAIIRPSKKHLAGKQWTEVQKTIWMPPADGSYYFKKSHSIAYSMTVVVQMNLLEEQATR